MERLTTYLQHYLTTVRGITAQPAHWQCQLNNNLVLLAAITQPGRTVNRAGRITYCDIGLLFIAVLALDHPSNWAWRMATQR